MLNYSNLRSLARKIPPGTPEAEALDRFEEHLVPLWVKTYHARCRSAALSSVQLGAAVFLFDVEHERLVTAWAASRGPVHERRDAGRMARFPKGAGRLYHRGHAIPHSMGGPLDLNLVPQLGAVNVGAFRELERDAVAMPGALYFTFWYYARGRGQVPTSVDQGLLRPGTDFRVVNHPN
jgi:hypothetical protein